MSLTTSARGRDDLVSVVLPTHNSQEYLDETMTAILGQSHTNLEVVVTDDGSSDATVKMLARWVNEDSRVRLERHNQPEGPAYARNNSIRRAEGAFLAFCDSDDIWHPEKLERQLAFMRSRSTPFSFTATRIIDESGMPTGRFVDLNAPDSVGYRDMLRKRAVLSCSTVVLERRAFPGLRMPLLFRGQDYATWLEILRPGNIRAHCLREPLTSYRITPGSVSRNKFKKAIGQWRIYRDLEALSIRQAAVSFCFYAVRAVMR